MAKVAGDEHDGCSGLDLDAIHRSAMAALCSGVAVVTTAGRCGEPCGLTVTSLSSFSADPPSVVVCVGHGTRSHAGMMVSDHFGVHLLTKEQKYLAETFADHSADKFAWVSWGWDREVPRIDGVLAFLRCRRTAVFDRYDHALVIGDVLDGTVASGPPLVYAKRAMGDLRALSDHVAAGC
ncbi:MAG: hypothetical protein QOG63_1920 [Thermoleophilaceae bacterium]|jgi:flavin reductase (DIM6/NTAB) family NADH-FMN oxidoreductase RutF|nr:hypothetical protein [Thermoleophilaceae bacterium]